MRTLESETVMFAYLDPPFQTGRVLTGKKGSFDDTWDSLEDYLSFLRPRFVEVRRLLCNAGSVVVHIDPRTSHYVKVLLDEIFGRESFASEIIWRYRRWPSKTLNFQRVHDVLLRYVKDSSATPRFNTLYEPSAPSTLKAFGTSKQVAFFKGGKRRTSKTAEKSLGVPLGDVWEMAIIAPVAKERLGYPTQKPEALLERLIFALTNPEDTILEPFAGSGTACAVAQRLGRKFIGIDENIEAYEIAKKRVSL